jgi:hypothetical protein
LGIFHFARKTLCGKFTPASPVAGNFVGFLDDTRKLRAKYQNFNDKNPWRARLMSHHQKYPLNFMDLNRLAQRNFQRHQAGGGTLQEPQAARDAAADDLAAGLTAGSQISIRPWGRAAAVPARHRAPAPRRQ